VKFCKHAVLTKKSKMFLTTYKSILQCHGESNPQPLYHWSVGGTTMVPVCCVVAACDWNLINIEATDYRSNFAKTILFEIVPVFRKYLSVSRWNLPGYFSVSFRFPQVTEFGKSTANHRRSTSPILFVSFTQPCDQHDRKIRTIHKSAARWRGRHARGYRKLILRANLLYVPNIKM